MKLFAEFLGLFLAIFSILLKEEVMSSWDILLWIPIVLGFAIYYRLDDLIGGLSE